MSLSFQELVESQDWEQVRNSIKRQRALKTLASSILTVLNSNAKANEIPPDILPSLFEKLRPLRDKSLCIDIEERFDAQLFSRVCSFETCGYHGHCNSNPMTYAPHILATLLEEHKRVYNHEKYPKYTLELIRTFVCEMWEDLLAGRRLVRHWRGDEFHLEKSNVVPKEKEEQLLSIQSLADLKKSKDLFGLWQNVEMLVLHTKSDNETPLLHALIKDGYPIVLVWLAAKIFPDQLCQLNYGGRIPLHYAAKAPIILCVNHRSLEFSASFCESVRWDPKGASFVKLLTALFPKGAQYVDNNGKLPLATYLEHASFPNFEDVSLLINAAPRALLTRDMKTHLLPFMIPTRNSYTFDYHDLKMTSLIYQILLENPAAVAIGATGKSLDSYHVRHLKNKVATVEAELADSKGKVNGLINAKNKAEDLIVKQSEDIVKKNADIVKQNEEIKRLTQLLDGKFSSEDSDISTKRARLE